MKTFPFVSFSTSSRVQAASAAYLRYRFSTREYIYLTKWADESTKDESRVKRKRSVCSLKREHRRRLFCPRIIMNLSPQNEKRASRSARSPTQ